MTCDATDRPRIGRASEQRPVEALRLAFARLSPQDRRQQVEALLASAGAGGASMEGLLEARRRGRLVGAVFFQVEAGKAAVIWPPGVISGEPAATAGELLRAACDLLAGDGARIVHALLDSVTASDDAMLVGAGFSRLANLLYMVSRRSRFPTVRPPTPLEFEPYCPGNHDRLARLVESTYSQTLDCAQLNGVRRIEDILAGYRATGVFDPARWLTVRHQAQDVGCLLLADHPEHGNWELVYMGLTVGSRGHGWGMDIAQHAQWLTGGAGRSRLVLAVDAANRPAIQVYTATGFEAWDRRVVYLKVLEGGRRKAEGGRRKGEGGRRDA